MNTRYLSRFNVSGNVAFRETTVAGSEAMGAAM